MRESWGTWPEHNSRQVGGSFSSPENYSLITHFGAVWKWTPERSAAALSLAQGITQEQTALDVQVTRKTLYNWLQAPEFSAEVDRLSSMIGVASRAERMRIAMRAVRQKIRSDGTIETQRDLLDWLKFAQSETHGVNLGLAALESVGG